MFHKVCILLLPVVCFVSACRQNEMNKAEAERSLKVLNSNLINFGTEISDSKDTKVLDFLISHPAAPVPFMKNSKGFISVKDFSFNNETGIYRWKNETLDFKKEEESDKISIGLTLEETGEFTFLLENYESIKVSSGEQFPTLVSAKILENGKSIWTLEFQSQITDNLPVTMNLQVHGKNYEIEANWNRTRTGNNGKLEINLAFNYLMKSLIKTNLNFNIGFGKRSYFIKQAELNQKLFDHTISGYVDYDKVDPTAPDYAASFNKHSHFVISENNRGKVGDIILATVENDELLDYHVEFSDGSKELFGKYIPLIDKIFNFKY